MKKLLFFLTLLLLLLLVPFILWQLKDDVPSNIAIIDKTVPNDDYREHQGIVWFLNHQKYKQKDGQAINKTTDYFGVHPNISEKKYEASELPHDYSDYDTIYLADSYGVYEDDTPWNERERKGARSNLIHGGLTETEWSAIVDRLNQNEKSLFIAEFNSFASPTEDGVRQSMTDLLGVEWSGWVGRYFDELDYEKNIEIPQWIVDQYGDNWNYTGEGFLLVNDLTYETVVLELNKHVMDKGISISFTDEGKEKFDITKQVKYNYWFDIIVPKSHATVYATYDWQLTNEGKELLT